MKILHIKLKTFKIEILKFSLLKESFKKNIYLYFEQNNHYCKRKIIERIFKNSSIKFKFKNHSKNFTILKLLKSIK